MKPIPIIAAALLAAASVTPASATLKESDENEFILHLRRSHYSSWFDFLDSCRPTGWISLYGNHNGGTDLFTDFIGTDGTATSANVWWNLTGDHRVGWIYVAGVGGSSQYYRVFLPEHRQAWSGTVTTSDGSAITQIGFYGATPYYVQNGFGLPDAGSTFGLLGLAVSACALGTGYCKRLFSRSRKT